jgi:fumarate hydratase class II
VHPNDHVNCGQSSNDVIPTAMHLAAATIMASQLLPAMSELEAGLRRKSDEFWPVIKTGRTHLQDATPIRLGQEFLGYAGQLELGRQRCEVALQELCALAIGGTAVGTGIGMHPEFAVRMVEELRKLTVRRRRPAADARAAVHVQLFAPDASCARGGHAHAHMTRAGAAAGGDEQPLPGAGHHRCRGAGVCVRALALA